MYRVAVVVLITMVASAAVGQVASRAGKLKPSASVPAKLVESHRAKLILSASKPATLMRVDDGVFALRFNSSIDLTDRKILLSFPQDGNNGRQNWSKGSFVIYLNGDSHWVRLGTRLDLKRGSRTQGFVADKEVCVLDVTNFVAPKGSPPVATFRLHCL